MQDRKFKTDIYPFESEYEKNALLQKGFNRQIIVDLVQYILRKFPWAEEQPVSILDLCCGDGGATDALLSELDKHGVKVEKLVGVDIAPEQIEKAKLYAKNDSRLQFNVENVEKMQYRNEFDIVISLFGLHWIEDINNIAQLISESLKPEGAVMFFVPLEKNDFFAMRQALMEKPEWKEIFSDFTINPFIDNEVPYISAFSRYFCSENESGVTGDQPVYFSEDEFKRFLSSWMQEVRYLNGMHGDSKSYLKQLVDGVQASGDPASDVRTIAMDGQVKIRFLEKFFWYYASKSENNTEIQNAANKNSKGLRE